MGSISTESYRTVYIVYIAFLLSSLQHRSDYGRYILGGNSGLVIFYNRRNACLVMWPGAINMVIKAILCATGAGGCVVFYVTFSKYREGI